MATAAYPSTNNYHSAGYLDPAFDERAHRPVNNWDEEVVPALKRQMDADRGDASAWQQQVQSSRPRPTPKRSMRNDEIIQDGLGNDELIPSEWATGSHARFVTASSSYARGRTQEHDGGYHHTQANTSSANEWGANNYNDGSPTSLSISQAREKARRLARERGDEEVLLQLPNGGGDESLLSSQRMRTLSTPMQPANHATSNKYDEDGVRNAPRAVSRDGDATPTTSRIPLPASGSMSKFVGGTSPPTIAAGTAPLRTTKSAALLSQKDAASRAPPVVGRHSTPNKGTSTRSTGKSYGALQQRSPPANAASQDVLDEFGPLGGSPRHPRGMGVDEFGSGLGDVSRSASNPWDEELIPTVKRRLAQEAMAQKDPRFSHVDGLIDTWDRFGNPLSTRTVSAQRREAEAVAAAEGNTSTEQEQSTGSVNDTNDDQQAQTSPSQHSPRGADEQQDRLRRLTQQLDMGFQDTGGAARQAKGSQLSTLAESPRQAQGATMHAAAGSQELRERAPRQRQQRQPGEQAYEMQEAEHRAQRAQQPSAASSSAYTTAQQQRLGQHRRRTSAAAKPTAAEIPQTDERVSGGCKCIIM